MFQHGGYIRYFSWKHHLTKKPKKPSNFYLKALYGGVVLPTCYNKPPTQPRPRTTAGVLTPKV